MGLESGSNVTMAYVRERDRGTTPAAVGTPTSIAATATNVVVGAASSRTTITRGDGGSWITDGFEVGQKITIAGFDEATDSLGDNNGDFEVHSVTATVLTLTVDTGQTGTAATGGPVTFEIRMETLRLTTRNFNVDKRTLESAEVRTTGLESDSRHGFTSASGTIAAQVSEGDQDKLLEFALRNTLAPVTIGTPATIAVSAVSSGVATIDFDTLALITAGVRPGDFITLAGMSDSDNNGRYRVITLTADSPTAGDTRITARAAEPARTPAVEAANASATVAYTGRRVDIANSLYTWTMERTFGGISKYQPFRRTAANSLQVSISPEAIIGVSLEMLGGGSAAADEGQLNNSSIANSAPLAATSNAPYAAFDGTVFVDGAPIAVITSLDFTVALNRSVEAVVGARFSPDIFDGTAQITGNIAFFLSDTELLVDNFINESELTLWVSVESADQTKFLNLCFPRVKINSAPIDPPQSGPVTVQGTFRALEDATYATAMWAQIANAS